VANQYLRAGAEASASYGFSITASRSFVALSACAPLFRNVGIAAAVSVWNVVSVASRLAFKRVEETLVEARPRLPPGSSSACMSEGRAGCGEMCTTQWRLHAGQDVWTNVWRMQEMIG